MLYLDTTSSFDIIIDEDLDVAIGDISSKDVGLAFEISYDDRDNVFTPNNGHLFKLAFWRHDKNIGSDYDYWKGTIKSLTFFQVNPQFIFGLRFEASSVNGRPPFYAYPWVKLRGIPAMRYQGKKVGMIEIEARWNVLPKWAVVGFAGAGMVNSKLSALQTQDDIVTYGIGGRYLFIPDQELWLGLDIARGPQDLYGYITVGHVW